MKPSQTKELIDAETSLLAAAMAREIWSDCSMSGQFDPARADQRLSEILDEVRTVAHKMQARKADATKRKACPGCTPRITCPRIADAGARRAAKTALVSGASAKTVKVRKAS